MKPDYPTTDPRRLLTDVELHQLRGLAPQFLKDDRRRGRRIPFVQIGKKVFYRLADVDAAVEGLRRGPAINKPNPAARSPAGTPKGDLTRALEPLKGEP